MTLVLDTGTVAAGKRAELLQDAFCFASARCRVVHLRDDSAVWGRVRYVPLGPAAEILHHEGSAMWLSRRAEHIESAPAERLSLGIPGTAGGVWMQHGIARPMRAGDLVPVDLTSPYDLRFADGGRSAVQMDIADLSVTVDQVRAASGRLEASPVYGLARDHIRLLCRDAAGLAGSPAAAVRDVWSATAHLVSALVVTAVPDGGGPARDALEQTLLLRAVWYARAHLADPALDLEAVARVHGVSVRRLRREWAAVQLGFGEWLARERVTAARAELRQPGARSGGLAGIAGRCGFRDVPDFRESFRRAVGVTPEEWLAGRE